MGASRASFPGGGMMKRQWVVAIVLLLLIPLVLALGGLLSNMIDPEIAAGHPNYVRNYHLLSLLKNLCFLASVAGAGVLWMLACLLVIRSKKRSYLWLILAALGPLGFAVHKRSYLWLLLGGIGPPRFRRPGDAERRGGRGS